VERHDAVQNHQNVNVLRLQEITVKGHLLQDVVENGVVSNRILRNPRVIGHHFKVVIVEVKVTAPLFSLGVSAGDTEAVQKKTRKNAML